MEDEEAFHRMLDANPEDHGTRMVFADWLQDRGDPRAEGYRALGALKKRPYDDRFAKGHAWTHSRNDIPLSEIHGAKTKNKTPVGIPHGLPEDWLEEFTGRRYGMNWSEDYKSRREAEDAAALAFSQLPPERQAELMNPPEKLSRIARAVRKYRRAKG